MTLSLFPPVHSHLPGGVPSKLDFKDSVRVCQVCLSRASQAEEIARLRHRLKPALFNRWSTAKIGHMRKYCVTDTRESGPVV